MTARSENRYLRNSMAAARERNTRASEIESLSLQRHGNLGYSPTKSASVSKQSVRIWMRANASDYETATQLAEAAVANFEFAGDPLGDETHWIWDLALDALPSD